jgi:hypothetical protein
MSSPIGTEKGAHLAPRPVDQLAKPANHTLSWLAIYHRGAVSSGGDCGNR